jgi:hypothetical protein
MGTHPQLTVLGGAIVLFTSTASSASRPCCPS